MYVSDSYRFIFVRPAKAASTSILSYLDSVVPDLILRSHSWAYDSQHIPLWYVIDKMRPRKKKYFKFSVIRNPFDRAVSIWKYTRQNFEDPGAAGGTLLEFMNYLHSGKCLFHESKYQNLFDFTKGCDFVIRMENLQEDFNVVCDKIGIPPHQLPSKNKTQRKHYTEYYDDETRELVAQYYAKDIERFGYEFEE